MFSASNAYKKDAFPHGLMTKEIVDKYYRFKRCLSCILYVT